MRTAVSRRTSSPKPGHRLNPAHVGDDGIDVFAIQIVDRRHRSHAGSGRGIGAPCSGLVRPAAERQRRGRQQRCGTVRASCRTPPSVSRLESGPGACTVLLSSSARSSSVWCATPAPFLEAARQVTEVFGVRGSPDPPDSRTPHRRRRSVLPGSKDAARGVRRSGGEYEALAGRHEEAAKRAE